VKGWVRARFREAVDFEVRREIDRIASANRELGTLTLRFANDRNLTLPIDPWRPLHTLEVPYHLEDAK
jgi:hypothetical protein